MSSRILPITSRTRAAATAYQAAKRQKQLLDYDDLLVMLRQTVDRG